MIFAFSFTLMISDALRNKASSHASGAPEGMTGSPGDGWSTCTNCHPGPTAESQSGWITSNIPSAGYLPGATYTITATATRANHTIFGFEVSPQDISGNVLGTLIVTNSAQTQFVGFNNYITHTSGGINGSGGSKSWTFDWTAPVSGTGDVTFYGAFNVANGNNNHIGDTIYTSTLLVPECSQPAQPSVITGNTIACSGASQTYSVTPDLSVTSYLWTLPPGWAGSSTTNSINTTAGTSAGTISVTSSNYCGTSIMRTLSVTVNQVVVSVSASNINCNGADNGSAMANPSGGTLPYTYQWSDSNTSQTILNLSPSTYTVTVTDAIGCTGTASVIITQPAALSVTPSNSNATCFEICNGTVSSFGTGGTSPYTYLWNGGLGSGNNHINVCAGTFTVTISDFNGCTTTASTTVTEPAAISINTFQVNSNCGASDGSASVSAGNGVPPYSYLWSNSQTTNAISGLSAGTYTVTVTDANMCSQSAAVLINDNGAPAAVISNQVNVSCYGGSDGEATINVTGGFPPITYLWSNGDTDSIASGLSGLTYSVIVTDSHGCITGTSVTITEPAILSAIPSSTNITCNNLNNGTATVTPSGGVSPYTYQWSNSSSAQTISNLSPASYTVTVTDDNGCTLTSSVTVTEPLVLLASLNSVNVTCNGMNNGTATAIPSGGTSPYTYQWSNSNSTQTISNLSPASYTVTVTDVNGCTSSLSLTITEPAVLSASFASTDVTCNGMNNGTATVIPSGGTSPYTYQWSNSNSTQTISNLSPASYTVTVTDVNGCTSSLSLTITEPALLSASFASTDVSCNGMNNGTATVIPSGGTSPFAYQWSNSSSTQTISNLSPASYTVTVTDYNGCTLIASVTITQPAVLTVNPTASTTICIGQSIVLTANASGGTLFYSYQWSTGASASGILVSPVTTTAYSVTVTDAHNCTVASQTIVISVNPPLSVSAILSDTICEGEAVIIGAVASGGDGNYTYLWLPVGTGNGSGPISVSPNATTTYHVMLTDGCGTPASSDSLIITVNPLPPVPTITLNLDTLFSSPASSYQWYLNGTPISGETLFFHIASQTGSYTVSITDSNACSSTSSPYSYIQSGLTFEQAERVFRIYPNPTNNQLYFDFHSSWKYFSVSVYDLVGNEILKSVSLKYEDKLDVSFLADGVYFLLLDNDIERIMLRFEVVKY
ncbi:MAG: T9SS type A sorting domain-containing protein [Bacteroidia bacterium]|nr:T9SS type A sorting domain-containing protein [Bacteroidia bacterium]